MTHAEWLRFHAHKARDFVGDDEYADRVLAIADALDAAREALEFYSMKPCYLKFEDRPSLIDEDCGAKARAALAKLEGK